MMWRDCGKIGVIFMSGLKGSSEKSALFKQKKEEKKITATELQWFKSLNLKKKRLTQTEPVRSV